ncbi:MAG: tetratricopeptide repeat protein [Rhodospirillales bacterium]|nr:tetratricopeptide repeat protein [Rhodospirillales bacterium]
MSKIRVLVMLLVAIVAVAASGRAQEGAGNTAPSQMYLLPEGDAFALYDRGFFYLRRGDWVGAAASFEELLERFPQDELAPNARYWLAESYLQQGEAMRAARAFHDVYAMAPGAARAPDALYKEGVALARAGDHYNACLAFLRLKQTYPEEAMRYPMDERC